MTTPASCRVFYRSPNRAYPIAERAEGVYLWDTNGKRYLDACAGALVANIGHGRRDIAEVAARQIERLDFVHGSQFSSAPLEALAERIGRWLPSGSWRFFAASGGSEATESAIKLARQYHVERGNAGKRIVVSRWSGYHGASLGALGVSGLGARRRLYEPLLRDDAYLKIPRPDPSVDGRQDAAALEALLQRIGSEHVAAFFAEPIVGAAAPALAPAAGYYEEIRRICSAHDVLYVSDEVMSGLGRTGTKLGLDRWHAVPDVVVLGKGLGAGYVPLAGIAASDAVVETIAQGSGTFTHGYTYAGHPVSAAVGSAVLDVMEREDLVRRSADTGAYLLGELRALADETPEVLEVRGYGLLLGVVLGDPRSGVPFATPGYAYHVGRIALELGLNVYPGTGSGEESTGDHLLIGPPLTITREESGEMVAMLRDALVTARAEADRYR
ncbi:MAG: aminotransferase class III-fold pyridoxal phosphate-dependent enzyme [Trueperaceae bacterium]